MADSKKNMELEELFRNKLEGTELIPSGAARDDLMRKLARREFLHFNPVKINIYYIGGLVSAALVSALLLTSHPLRNKENENVSRTDKSLIVDSAKLKSEVIQSGRDENSVPVPDNGNMQQKKKANNPPVNGNKQKDFRKEPLKMVHSATGKTDSLLKNNQIKDQVTGSGINKFTLQKRIFASFEVSSASGCLPLKVKFVNSSFAYDSVYWTFGDGGYSVADSPEWIFDMQGEYKVILKVFGIDGSESSASLMMNVFPKPVARFEIHTVNPIIPDDEIRFLNYSMDGIRCRWEFGDGKESEVWEPEHKYDHFDNYNIKLIVWSEHGCTDSLTVSNAFAGSGCYITFPNAFIPNIDGPAGGFYSLKSDEAAQIFHPVTSGVADYQMRVFSKIGILIFESNDINIGWDGYHKGQLCDPGVYVWKVRGTYKNGEPFVKMGDITLLKK